ncbi:MAG: nucleoside deaminase [Deltaproteobacteria bacterium]|nr:nucleoside deaminase [Deltaproteobacteria bacterium]
MQLAMEAAKQGIAQGQSPFGAAVVLRGELICTAHNTVWQQLDPTAHAEINAIRLASKILRTIDFSGATMYTTCEPCPMCLAAIHWARFDRVVYGATISDAAASGFNELRLSAKDMVSLGGSRLSVEMAGDRAACVELFALWASDPQRKTY